MNFLVTSPITEPPSSSIESCNDERLQPSSMDSFPSTMNTKKHHVTFDSGYEYEYEEITTQKPNKKRRYMRRGSRCPSMLTTLPTSAAMMMNNDDDDDDAKNEEVIASNNKDREDQSTSARAQSSSSSSSSSYLGSPAAITTTTTTTTNTLHTVLPQIPKQHTHAHKEDENENEVIEGHQKESDRSFNTVRRVLDLTTIRAILSSPWSPLLSEQQQDNCIVNGGVNGDGEHEDTEEEDNDGDDDDALIRSAVQLLE